MYGESDLAWLERVTTRLMSLDDRFLREAALRTTNLAPAPELRSGQTRTIQYFATSPSAIYSRTTCLFAKSQTEKNKQL